MNYDREILAVLTQAGEKGLKLEHIVRHVVVSTFTGSRS